MTDGICSGCGGPHRFDTSVPSTLWNAVVRAEHLPEYLCTTCIILAFVAADRSFTATLWGNGLNGVPIELRIHNQAAIDAQLVTEENNALRAELFRLQQHLADMCVEMRHFQNAVRQEIERTDGDLNASANL